MDVLVAILAGAMVGALTGLLPGLHVNTLAAIAGALHPAPGVVGAVALVAAGTVHTIVNILPTTYLGVPSEDEVVGVLPAHRLLLQGRGGDVVAASVAASLTGVVVALLVAWPLRLAWAHLEHAARTWAVPLLALIAALLILQERHKGLRAVLAAAAVFVAAGALGMWSSGLPYAPWVDVPPSSLLPLLGGLFGGAGLTFALQTPASIPDQRQSARLRRDGTSVLGAGLAGITALMPGLTGAVATSFVPGTAQRPLRAVAAMSAINSAHATLALVVYAVSGGIRSGLAAATDDWASVEWAGPMWASKPGTLLMAIGMAAVVGAVLTSALHRGLAAHAARLPARSLAVFGLAFLAATSLVLTGWMGLGVFGAAVALGRIPVRLGVRRVHLVGCLMVPIMLWL